MRKAESSGIIPFRTTRGKIEYLVLKSRTRDWEFPKGTVEDSEELQQTSLRELEEETNIEDVKIIDGFKQTYKYKFRSEGELVHKKVHLFVGKSYKATAELSKEHNDYQWRTYEQAKNTLTHKATKNILEKAHKHLKKNNY